MPDIVLFVNGIPLVVVSRRAAIRYYEAFQKARIKLLKRLVFFDTNLLSLSEDKQKNLDEETRFLIAAAKNINVLKKLEFAAIISGDHYDPPFYKKHSDKARHEIFVGKDGRFKKSVERIPLTSLL